MCSHDDCERYHETAGSDGGGDGEGTPRLLPLNRTEVEEIRIRQGEDSTQCLLSRDNGAGQ